jgi:pimeloyl-ACP methyl ester carboxylesterase
MHAVAHRKDAVVLTRRTGARYANGMRISFTPRLSRLVVALVILGGVSGCATFRATRIPLPKAGRPLGELLAAARDHEHRGELLAYNDDLREMIPQIDRLRDELSRGPVAVRSAAGTFRLSAPQFLAGRGEYAEFEIDPADRLKIRGLRERHVRGGVGLPVVAAQPDLPEETRRRGHLPDVGLFYGPTALVRFEGETASLELVDPAVRERVRWHGREEPLAADFSAPLARLLDRHNPIVEGLIRMLRSDSYADQISLRTLRRPDSKKTPVVFVHGLLSVPLGWAQMINDLTSDPEIAKNYEFWVFGYPSGLPISMSADALRQHLDEVFAPAGAASRDIVLVGHSMGGILSRLVVTDSGDRLGRAVFGRPISKLPLSPKERVFVERLLVFQSRDYVGRAVFICTPHRGAEMATSPIGRFARSIIRLPGDFISLGQNLVRVVVLTLPGDAPVSRIPTGIDSLSPENPVLIALDKLPIRSRVPYHSIIGDRGRKDTPNSSDGVVPYSSAHLEGAESEKIIPSAHGGLDHPQGIAEVRRILRKHKGLRSER